VKRLSTLVAGYVGNADPLAAAGNLVALVVGLDQPLYPLALYWATGADVRWTFIVFLSAPCFLAVPAVARRHSLTGRAMLVVVGSLDTFASVAIYGRSSGNELYLIPCLLLAALLFRRNERLLSLGLVAVIAGGFLGLYDRYGTPLLGWSDADYEAMWRINAVSVAMLTALIAASAWRARRVP
jgi:hypothetical protein